MRKPRRTVLGLLLVASAALASTTALAEASGPTTSDPNAPVASEKPLTAAEFDALTQGNTFDTYSFGNVYGVEKFYPGGRSIWQDASRCKYGTWAQVGDQICFTYEDDPANPDCWTYFDKGGSLTAYWNGDPAEDPIELRPTTSPMTCDEFLGV